MSEPGGAVLRCECLQRRPDRGEELIQSAPGARPHGRFDFGTHQFNGIEVRVVRREKQEVTALCFDERPNGRSVM